MSESSPRPVLVVVVGPTAAGKSGLALRLAASLGAEIISADSQQVYRYFNIGTGKLSLAEQQGIPHHLIDIVEPEESFSAAHFIERADAAIGEISQRGRRIVVVGGTGLYVKALVRGLFSAPPSDPELRQQHRCLWDEEGPVAFYQRLAAVDPEAAARIEPQDFVRISRALEVYEQTGRPISLMQRQHGFLSLRYQAVWIGLAPARDELRRAIGGRVEAMMDRGWLEEVRQLIAAGYEECRPMGALGYRHLRAHLCQGLDFDEAVRQTKRDTWRFARRQMSWFASEPDIFWYRESAEVNIEQLNEMVRRR